MLADYWEKLYKVIEWIRCNLNFHYLDLPSCVWGDQGLFIITHTVIVIP